MFSRRAALVATALLLAGLTGCAGTPAATPTPTPTGFASEEEAFAAAEETYRAYVDELNAYHAGDEDADPLRFLSGELREREAEINRQSEEAGLRIEGDLKIASIEHVQASLVARAASVRLDVCSDASEWRLINTDGEDVSVEGVPKRYLLHVEMTTINVDELVIVASVPEGEGSC
jgi:hypothetical protein